MTCRGYDAKAVKISKTLKRVAAKILDAHERGEFIRGFVVIEQTNSRGSGRKDSGK